MGFQLCRPDAFRAIRKGKEGVCLIPLKGFNAAVFDGQF